MTRKEAKAQERIRKSGYFVTIEVIEKDHYNPLRDDDTAYATYHEAENALNKAFLRYPSIWFGDCKIVEHGTQSAWMRYKAHSLNFLQQLQLLQLL